MIAVHGSKISIVDSENSALVKNTEKPFILVLKTGENLFDAILRCADAANLKSALVTGLGTLTDVTVAYYHTSSKSYHTQLFTGMYELISANGNISFLDGQRFLHLHAALGKEDYQVVGGHIMSATVGPSAEIAITPLTGVITRQYDPTSGLKVLCSIPSTSQDFLR